VRTEAAAAGFQGSNHALRLPLSSRVDQVLWAALVARYRTCVDDYPFPMLRVDLSSNNLGTERQIYLAPLLDPKGAYLIGSAGMGGVAEGATAGLSAAGLEALLPPHRIAELYLLAEDAVSSALQAQGVTVSEGEMRTLIESLLEYSGPHAKWRIRENLGGRQREGQAQVPVGISLTLDQDFDAWVGGVSGAAHPSRVGSDREGEYAEKVRKALASLLKIPVGCVEIAGLHRGSIIVDLNLSAPPGDPRSPMQLFEHLAALIAGSDSPLKQDSTLCNAVRAILRGTPHHIPAARRAGGVSVAAAVGDGAGARNSGGATDSNASHPSTAHSSAVLPAATIVSSVQPAARPPTAPRPSSAKQAAPTATTRPTSAKVTDLARSAVLADAASRLQAGWVNKKFFYGSSEGTRVGPVSPCLWQ
jgi:hypothetical protein